MSVRARLATSLLASLLVLTPFTSTRAEPDPSSVVYLGFDPPSGLLVILRLDGEALPLRERGARHVALDTTAIRVTTRIGTGPERALPPRAWSIVDETPLAGRPQTVYRADVARELVAVGVHRFDARTTTRIVVSGYGVPTAFASPPATPIRTEERIAVPDRSDDAAARAALLGRRVYRRGYATYQGPGTFGSLRPATIVGLERRPDAVTEYLGGSIEARNRMINDNDFGMFGIPNTLYHGIDSWVVTLRGLHGEVRRLTYGSTSELREAFSTSPPPRALAKVALASATVSDRVGWTRDEIAWMYGPPNEPVDPYHLLRASSWASLAREREWTWAFSGFFRVVTFRGDRVVRDVDPDPAP